MSKRTSYLMCALLLCVLSAMPAGADVIWDFEGGNDHGFTLWSVNSATPVADDPTTAGDEAVTGKALPGAGVAWSIGRPDQYDGQKPAVTEGDKVKADGTLEYNQAGLNHPFAFPVNSRGQESYLNTYNLSQWGDNLNTAANDQIATSPLVRLEAGAQLSVWAQGGGSGTHAPELEANPADGYTDGSSGVAVLSAVDGTLLESVLTNGQGTLREDTIDLSAYAGQKVYIEVVDAFQGGWGWLSVDEILITNAIDLGGIPPARAHSPLPGNGATDVPHDVILTWTPGEYAPAANGHKVYFSDSFDDVNEGVTTADQGLTSAPEFDVAQVPFALDFDKAYYWRVDEANGVAGWDRGDIWTFTVEPKSILIPVDAEKATASSSIAKNPPDMTVNGSGLTDITHSTNGEAMWLSAQVDLAPWLMYEFNQTQKLDHMLIWNSNSASEEFIGWGIKDVNIETSLDGVDWTALTDAIQIRKAPGLPTYDAPQTIDFGLVQAKYVRINILNNWGGLLKQYGVSEVQFYGLPVYARTPNPESDSVDILPDTVATWRAGREAAEHTIYMSTDVNAVADATASSVTSETNSLDLASLDLQLGETYYWRVDEVNHAEVPAVWAGPVWSLRTPVALTVDDFEGYGNVSPNRPFQTWLDGFGYSADEFFPVEYPGNGTGAGIGHDIWSPGSPYFDGSIMEESITLPGSNQSMPFYYSNTGGAASQVDRTWATPQDWSGHGVQTLVVNFRGTSGNTGGPLYVKINGAKVTYPDPTDLGLSMWQQWQIDLTSLGINLNAVTSMSIGVDGMGNGLVYIDDLLLYREAPETVLPVEPSTDGLVALYSLENNTNDSSGQGHNGVAVGDPEYVAGVEGMAMAFDGSGSQYVDLGTYDPAAGTGQMTVSLWAKWQGLSGKWQGLIGKRDTWSVADMMWQIEANIDSGELHFMQNGSSPASGNPVLPVGEWTHVGVVYDGVVSRFFVNGQETGSGNFTFGSDTEAALVLGDCVGGGGNPFYGALDEIRLYNRSLSAGEIRYLAGDR